MMKKNECRIFFISSEVYPLAKTGGLADVAGSLPKALSKLGYQVVVATPFYKKNFPSELSLEELHQIKVSIGEEVKEGFSYHTFLDGGIPVLLLSQEDYFNRENLYGDQHGDYEDNAERFSYFCRGVLLALKNLGWKPDIIHCHDWQTALLPFYVKNLWPEDDFYHNSGSLFTIHNLAYQGLFPRDKLGVMGIGDEFFTPDKLEFHGKVNTMKAALVYSDLISTVSPTYSKEIQVPEYGFGLDGVLRSRKDDLCGILNGIDYDTWNPSQDKQIAKNYSADNLEGKKENKKMLQKENNLPLIDVPLVGLISRLADQKGVDLIAGAIEEMMNLPLQFVLLGRGDYRYNRMFEEIGKEFPQKTGIHIGFDLSMARRIYAGSDIFLMPSRYEPCGLGQMISLRYGTIPVVRKTGGLADTVRGFNPTTGEGDGFLFKNCNSGDMIDVLRGAIEVYEDKENWEKLIRNGMKKDFSWEKSATEYSKVYENILRKK